jgi:acyl-CoA synthetase (NDP forming)
LENTKEVIQTLWKSKIPYYPFPETAAKALANMCEFSEWMSLPKSSVKTFTDVDKKRVEDIIKKGQQRTPNSILEPEGYEVLSAYKLPVLPFALAKNEKELVKYANEIGYPVVMKIVSPDILHKTDVNGVAIDITSDDELKMKYNDMQCSIQRMKPDAKIEGYLIQKMANNGIETIMGIKKDPQFGSLIMFGLGGIYVEVLKDVSFRIFPIKELAALHMIKDIKSFRILKGFRGKGPSDIDKIQDSLLRLSQLVTDFPEFTEIDINPFVVYEQGKGAYAIDARFLL